MPCVAEVGLTMSTRLRVMSNTICWPLSVPVGAVTSSDIYTEARELAKVSDHIVVQIPLVEDSLIPIARLTAEGVIVCATFVYNAAQATIAAKAGATSVRVALDDILRRARVAQTGDADALMRHEAPASSASMAAASARISS